MTNAELLAKIKAEIERLKMVQLKRIQEGDLVDAEPYDKNEAYNELLSFLSTLESEKPNGPTKEEPIDGVLYAAACGIKNATIKSENPINQDEELNEEIKRYIDEYYKEDSIVLIAHVARHFAEWGAEHLVDERKTSQNDLVKAAEAEEDRVIEEVEKDDRGCPYISSTHVYNAFVRGAKWDREQMMSESVEADVNIYRDIVAGKSWAEFVVEMPTNNLGDKVRVIVLPKEDSHENK